MNKHFCFGTVIALALCAVMLFSLLPLSAAAASVKFVSGDSGDVVKAIQTALKDEGKYSGSIDGKYGTGTVNAVKAFQKAKKLTQDGKCGVNTLKALGLYSDDKVTGTAVTDAAVRLRRSPSTSHPAYYVMAKGTKLSIISKTGEWYRVRTGDGIEGYAAESYISVDGKSDAAGTVREGKVTGIVNYVNIRKGPSTATESIGRLTNGTALYVLNVGSDWHQIKTKAGLTGYVSATYIKVSSITVAPDDTDIKAPTYTLKRGMNNNADVRKMQERLKELGYFDSGCTGNYASVTFAAVVDFQKANGLTADGVAGAKTLAKIYSSDAVPKKGGKNEITGDDDLIHPLPSTTLRKNMKNDDVVTMQKRLKELGYFTATCTGLYGDKTVAAVKAFQKKNNLKADGIAGSKTLSAMYSASAVPGAMTEDEKLKAKIDNMIEIAQSYMGAKYVRGGNGPKSFDCSGFTTRVFREAYSYTMPRTAYTQGYNNFGRKIKSMSELKRGDLVFFNTNKNDSDRCDHVGIYMGKNQFIHASSTEGKIVISDISKRWWAEIFSWGKRVIE